MNLDGLFAILLRSNIRRVSPTTPLHLMRAAFSLILVLGGPAASTVNRISMPANRITTPARMAPNVAATVNQSGCCIFVVLSAAPSAIRVGD